MTENEFQRVYGSPGEDARSDRIAARLRESASGRALEAATGLGSFHGGFLSVGSLREEVALGRWARWLPDGAFLYASSALGFLYIGVEELMWLVNTQTGSILPTDYQLDEAVLKAASLSTREDLLDLPLFDRWLAVNTRLAATEMLAPEKPLIHGGEMQVEQLVRRPMADYLRETADLFEDDGPNAISIMDPDDES